MLTAARGERPARSSVGGLRVVGWRLGTMPQPHRASVLLAVHEGCATFVVEPRRRPVQLAATGAKDGKRSLDSFRRIAGLGCIRLVQSSEMDSDLSVETGGFLRDLPAADDLPRTGHRPELRAVQRDQSKHSPRAAVRQLSVVR